MRATILQQAPITAKMVDSHKVHYANLEGKPAKWRVFRILETPTANLF
jgi:hypothetical protein